MLTTAQLAAGCRRAAVLTVVVTDQVNVTASVAVAGTALNINRAGATSAVVTTNQAVITCAISTKAVGLTFGTAISATDVVVTTSETNIAGTIVTGAQGIAWLARMTKTIIFTTATLNTVLPIKTGTAHFAVDAGGTHAINTDCACAITHICYAANAVRTSHAFSADTELTNIAGRSLTVHRTAAFRFRNNGLFFRASTEQHC